MKSTTCEFGGKHYKIDYTLNKLVKGIEYSGILFLETPVKFKYISYHDLGKGIFYPEDTEEGICQAIMKIITKYEKN